MWAYIPKGYCPSAQEQEDWTSESTWLFDLLEQSVTSSTKHLPSRSWRRAFKTKPWMMLPFGQTLKPSISQLGADAWMASWRRTPASRSASPGSSGELTTPGTSGRGLREESPNFDPSSASLKTWLDTFGSDTSTLYAQTSNALATGSRKRSLRRRKSAQATSENGSSSSQWVTPRAITGGAESAERKQELGRIESGGGDLQAQASNWPTPDTQNSRDGASLLSEAPGSHAMSLHHAVAMWGTPTGRDWKDGDVTTSTVETNGLLGRQASRYSLPAPAIPDGAASSETGPTSPRRLLNARFAEWLMGWPEGWTSLAPISSDSPEMASFLCAQRWHFEALLRGLNQERSTSGPEAAPQQSESHE